MARLVVKPPQELADEHTLAAQRHAGYFVGHPYRQPQQTPTVEVDRQRQWKEPNIVADDCIFCVQLTDDEAVRLASAEEVHQMFEGVTLDPDNKDGPPASEEEDRPDDEAKV